MDEIISSFGIVCNEVSGVPKSNNYMAHCIPVVIIKV